MTQTNNPLRIGVLGASGIGQVHIRILHSLGTQVCAVLGSTELSAEQAAKAVAETCTHTVTPHWSLERLLDEDLDAVTIATPANCHFVQIQAALERGLPVFCEKPMFWDDACVPSVVASRLKKLRHRAKKLLFVNTSNTVFLDAVESSLPAPESVKTFTFRFHTNGPFQHTEIALDLLPHGLSMLLHFFGERTLSNFSWEPTKHRCRCRFHYGNCCVEFDFQEHPEIVKSLSFRLNDCEFERVQKGHGASYQVSLRDTNSGEMQVTEDPFVVYLSRFLESCRKQPSGCDDPFPLAAANMNLMAQCIELGRTVIESNCRHPPPPNLGESSVDSEGVLRDTR